MKVKEIRPQWPTREAKLLPTLKKNGDIGDAVYAEPGAAVRVGDGPLHVEQTTAETIFQKITPAQAALLPRYTGGLELTEHSAGLLTSEACMKRWNRRNELLADGAERATMDDMALAGSLHCCTNAQPKFVPVGTPQISRILLFDSDSRHIRLSTI